MGRIGMTLGRIFLSAAPIRRMDYLVGLLILLSVALSTGAAVRSDPELLSSPALFIWIFVVGGYAVFLSLRRLRDLGVVNSNAGFMFLYASSIVAGGLGGMHSILASAVWLFLLAFLLLMPTATEL